MISDPFHPTTFYIPPVDRISRETAERDEDEQGQRKFGMN
jgi:hypothetical protein